MLLEFDKNELEMGEKYNLKNKHTHRQRKMEMRNERKKERKKRKKERKNE